MNPRRNDPCPCGSGKKFKKCCLRQQREERHKDWLEGLRRQSERQTGEESVEGQGMPPEVTLPTVVDDPLDVGPLDEGDGSDSCNLFEGRDESDAERPQKAGDARWDDFESAGYEGQIECFLKTLDEPDLMDAEMAFYMLERLHEYANTSEERQQWEILVGALREKLPEVYAHNAAYFLSWLVEDALADGRLEAAETRARQLAAEAGQDADMFWRVADQLSYHGRLATLVEMMRSAWPAVNGSAEVLPWAQDDFADRAIWLETLHYFDRANPPRPDDPEIVKRLQFYTDSLRPEWLAEFFELLSGRPCTTHAQDAGPAPPPAANESTRQRKKRPRNERKQEQSQRLYRLSVEFLGYTFREENVPYAKAETAREKILAYLAQRANGDLEEDHDRAGFSSRGRTSKRSQPALRPDAALTCPDRRSLDRYLAGLFGMFSENAFQVAMTMELVPAWLRFLRRKELIDAAQHAAAFSELAELNAELLLCWKKSGKWSALVRGSRLAWTKPP